MHFNIDHFLEDSDLANTRFEELKESKGLSEIQNRLFLRFAFDQEDRSVWIGLRNEEILITLLSDLKEELSSFTRVEYYPGNEFRLEVLNALLNRFRMMVKETNGVRSMWAFNQLIDFSGAKFLYLNFKNDCDDAFKVLYSLDPEIDGVDLVINIAAIQKSKAISMYYHTKEKLEKCNGNELDDARGNLRNTLEKMEYKLDVDLRRLRIGYLF